MRLIAYENQSFFDFPKRMEEENGLCGSNKDGTKRIFFRENRSAIDILNAAKDKDFNYVEKRKYIILKYNTALSEGGCSESCEPFLI